MTGVRKKVFFKLAENEVISIKRLCHFRLFVTRSNRNFKIMKQKKGNSRNSDTSMQYHMYFKCEMKFCRGNCSSKFLKGLSHG